MLEMFFASLDDDTMERLINVYESQDDEKLEEILRSKSMDIPKKELMEAMKVLVEMKQMME